MRPFGAWFGRLAMAGACLTWGGCGGSNVPDPDSDSSAATEAPRAIDRSEGPAPAEAPAAEAVAPAPAPAAAPVAVANTPPAAEAPAAAPAPGPALKGDSSGTEEMLKMASAAPATPPAGEAPAGAGPAAPGAATPPPPGSQEGPGPAASNAPMNPNASGPSAPQPGTPTSAPSGPGPGPGPGPGTPGELPSSAGTPGAPGTPGPSGPPGAAGYPAPGSENPGPGGPGGFGTPPGSNDANASPPIGPDTFNHPGTAVMAFLAALTAKDKDKLSQATAKRAPTEAAEKHRKIFAAIIEQSISDDELDEMSKAMKGFQVIQALPAKSTGRIGIIVAKQDGRNVLRRTIVARREKEGWKVLDIDDMYEFKPGVPPIFMRGGRRR